MIRRWLRLSVIAVLVTGCGTATFHPRPTGWVRSDLRPVTQPELAGGRLVLYVQAGGGLQVVGLDPATGRTVWHDSASPGGVTPGEPPFLGVAGSTVTFFSPVDDNLGTTQVVGVNAATGRRLWHTPTGLFTDWPGTCADDPSEICTTVFTGSETGAIRLQAVDGAVAGGVLVSQPLAGRSVGPDLFNSGPGSRGREELVAATGASVLWTRPLASMFPIQGASTDYGWDFDRITTSGLFVGWVGTAPLSSATSSATIDLSRNMTAGFRIADGTTVWRDAGTIYACNQQLPCPTAPSAAETGLLYRPPTTGLRLRATGTAHLSLFSLSSLSPGADVVVEGFDLATGKTLWSYDAGPDSSLVSGPAPPLLGSYLAVLPSTGGGRVALNLATGARGPVPAGAMAWCHSLVTYQMRLKWYDGKNSAPHYLRPGQEAIKPCQASGAYAATPPTVPAWAGTVADGLTAWSEPGEVAAAPTSS